MNADKTKLTKEIQRCNFVLVEANLYLDTHPTDQEALKYYQKYQKRMTELREEYENKFGKIETAEDGTLKWTWAEDPWPWQLEG